MEKKILFIIDAQYDFIDGGKLGVAGSEKKMLNLADYIREHGKEYEHIFASVDWHLSTHCSFKENGGIWPTHCVQHTIGAAIFSPITEAINEIKADFHVFTKGDDEDREEYSIMKNIKSFTEISRILKNNDIKHVDFCGIADIYCVKDSIEDFHRALPDIEIGVLTKYIGNMDEEKFNEYLSKSDSYIIR